MGKRKQTCCGTVVDRFNSVDMFGAHINFNISGKPKYNSCLGSCTTILIILIWPHSVGTIAVIVSTTRDRKTIQHQCMYIVECCVPTYLGQQKTVYGYGSGLGWGN